MALEPLLRKPSGIPSVSVCGGSVLAHANDIIIVTEMEHLQMVSEDIKDYKTVTGAKTNRENRSARYFALRGAS